MARWTALASLAAVARAADSPNVVLIYADDLGFGDPGFAGHPSNLTPNLDALRAAGTRLASWYSACPVCTGSRAALMTGRIYSRIGLPGVLGPTSQTGLPLRETTLADQFKKAGYATAMVGKWHLGQRAAYLPAARGFDSYLGIPFSDDMGRGRMSACGNATRRAGGGSRAAGWGRDAYDAHGFAQPRARENDDDPAADFLPLVHQNGSGTEVLEQPADVTFIETKYSAFATQFVRANAARKFFFYLASSHVHTTEANLPAQQYSGCAFRGTSIRGPFGDALAETDALVGDVVAEVDAHQLRSKTLFLFSSDNGPWMVQAQSAGSVGHLYARAAGYWNVGKGSTWEGGIRVPAFIAWDGVVAAGAVTPAAVSATDIFPTLSKLIGVPLPATMDYNGTSEPAVYDGVDQSAALFGGAATSARDAAKDCLFFFGGPYQAEKPSAARCGPLKVHYATGPGINGCDGCTNKYYDPPLVFDVEVDPSEQFPLAQNDSAMTEAVLAWANASYARFMSGYSPGNLTAANGGLAPDVDDERVNGTAFYGVCCDRQAPARGGLGNTCDCDGEPFVAVAAEGLLGRGGVL